MVGKAAGVTGASLLALRTGNGTFPEGMRAGHLGAAGALAGIGFTVSLFVTELAFTDPALRDAGQGRGAGRLGAGRGRGLGAVPVGGPPVGDVH